MHFNKNGGVILVLWAQICPLIEMMRSCKCFLYVSKMPTEEERYYFCSSKVNLHFVSLIYSMIRYMMWCYLGADPGFQVRGADLKKMRRAEEGAKNFGIFRVKNHDFYAKKSYFFQLRREVRNFWGISCEKSRFYAKKIIFFPILGGRSPGAPPPPLDPPLLSLLIIIDYSQTWLYE